MKIGKISVAVIIVLCMSFLLASCSINGDGLIGKWEFDAAEMQEDDMSGVKIEFTKDVMYLTNENTYAGYTMEAKYFKDDKCIYIQSISMDDYEEVYDEFLEFSYNVDGDRLLLDMEDAGLGKVIMKRQ